MHTIAVPEGLQTKVFVLGKGVLAELPELLESYFSGKKPWLIADENTWRAAGTRAEEYLRNAGFAEIPRVIFPGSPRLHPDYAISIRLAEEMPADCVPVAVGSGVINDLVKCAAGRREVPYCCVPTACSVDGFTSAGGAMSVDGFKRTVKCPAPMALCADTDVLATAPSAMFASGYADLLTKVPAGADWILADMLGEEPIRADVWQLIQGNIRRWVSDRENMLNVFEGLAATGYSMQMYQESRPASGAEHLASHIWEMEGLRQNGEEPSHGFKVGIGLLATTRMMEFVIEHSFAEIRPMMRPGLDNAARRQEVEELLSRGCYGGDTPIETAMSKHLVGEALANRRAQAERIWPELQRRLKAQLIPYADAYRMLLDVGCPVTPGRIGLTYGQYVHGFLAAQLIRRRYTILDFLYELGILRKVVESIADDDGELDY